MLNATDYLDQRARPPVGGGMGIPGMMPMPFAGPPPGMSPMPFMGGAPPLSPMPLPMAPAGQSMPPAMGGGGPGGPIPDEWKHGHFAEMYAQLIEQLRHQAGMTPEAARGQIYDRFMDHGSPVTASSARGPAGAGPGPGGGGGGFYKPGSAGGGMDALQELAQRFAALRGIAGVGGGPGGPGGLQGPPSFGGGPPGPIGGFGGGAPPPTSMPLTSVPPGLLQMLSQFQRPKPGIGGPGPQQY